MRLPKAHSRSLLASELLQEHGGDESAHIHCDALPLRRSHTARSQGEEVNGSVLEKLSGRHSAVAGL